MLENVFLLFKYFPEFNNSLAAGLFVFARVIGFITRAPIFSRKDFPFLAKLSFGLMLTVIFLTILKPPPPPAETSMLLSIILNVAFGVLIGFVVEVIIATISSAGDIINMQMGLSSSTLFDQNTRQQSSLLGTFLGFFGLIIFINIGGIYWLISAFERSFDIFPIYGTSLPLDKIVNFEYLLLVTGNVLTIGLQIASPVLLATLGQDIILGIISKTAPQVNVFQMSFLFKPVMGVVILVIILPMFVNIIEDYFSYFSQIY